MGRDVDAALAHDGDSQRMKFTGSGAGAENLDAITGEVAQPAFGHLAATGVSCAEEKDFALGHSGFLCYVTPKRRKQATKRSISVGEL